MPTSTTRDALAYQSMKVAGTPQSLLMLSWKSKDTGALCYVEFDVVTTETHEALMAITEHPVEVGVDVVDNARPKPKTLTIIGYVSNTPLGSNPGVRESSKNVPSADRKAPIFQVTALQLKVEAVPGKARPNRVHLDLPTYPILDLSSPGALMSSLNPGSLVSAGVGALKSALGLGGVHDWYSPAKEASQAKTYTMSVLGAKSPDDASLRAFNVYNLLLKGQSECALVTVKSSMGQVENMLIGKVGLPRSAATGNGADIEVNLTQVRMVNSKTVLVAPLPAELRGTKPQSAGTSPPVQASDADASRNTSLATGATGLGAGSGNANAVGGH